MISILHIRQCYEISPTLITHSTPKQEHHSNEDSHLSTKYTPFCTYLSSLSFVYRYSSMVAKASHPYSTRYQIRIKKTGPGCLSCWREGVLLVTVFLRCFAKNLWTMRSSTCFLPWLLPRKRISKLIFHAHCRLEFHIIACFLLHVLCRNALLAPLLILSKGVLHPIHNPCCYVLHPLHTSRASGREPKLCRRNGRHKIIVTAFPRLQRQQQQQ